MLRLRLGGAVETSSNVAVVAGSGEGTADVFVDERGPSSNGRRGLGRRRGGPSMDMMAGRCVYTAFRTLFRIS